MATRKTSLENLFSKLLLRQEIADIENFKRGKNLEKHLKLVEEKIQELNIHANEKAKFLLKTLDENIRLELKAFPNFKEDFDWLVETLKEVYGQTASPVSLCVSLLNVRQRSGQMIQDFISEIRITAMRLFPDENPVTREKVMLMTFMEGLKNQKHAAILRQLNPSSLQEAYLLLKNEKDDEYQCVMKVDSQVMEIQVLRRDLNSALQRIRVLETKMEQRISGKTEKQTRTIQCFRCKKTGHIKRNCQAILKCDICNRENHLAENCFFNKNKKVRNIENESVNSIRTDEIEERGDVFSEDFEDEKCNNDERNESNDAYIISHLSHPQREKRKTACNSKNKKYPKDVCVWNDYISGTTKRPRRPLKRQSSPTLISNSRPEKARNKPVIPAVVEGHFGKNVFMDSGCECNIIDNSFLGKVSRVNSQIKMLKSSGGNLACANGSPMKIIGFTVLNLKIGPKTMRLKFTVVESIFPNVIIGIRTMKKERISIIPAWDCVKVENASVPFVSKIVSPSLN